MLLIEWREDKYIKYMYLIFIFRLIHAYLGPSNFSFDSVLSYNLLRVINTKPLSMKSDYEIETPSDVKTHSSTASSNINYPKLLWR